VASGRLGWVEKQTEIWNAGDIDGFVDALGDDFEFTPDPGFPDSGTYRGTELRRWFDEWTRVWEDVRYELLQVEERGSVMIIHSRWHLVLKQAGAPADWDFTLVVEFEGAEDRPRRMWAFVDRNRALEKAEELTG
jgi:ketosteroid isomerase-like protein